MSLIHEYWCSAHQSGNLSVVPVNQTPGTSRPQGKPMGWLLSHQPPAGIHFSDYPPGVAAKLHVGFLAFCLT